MGEPTISLEAPAGSGSFALLGDDEPRWVHPESFVRTPNGWRLRGTRCPACDARFFPAAAICARCLHRAVVEHPLSITGVVHVSTTATLTQPGFFAPARFAWVDLPEDGVRVFAHLLPVDGPEPRHGDLVELAPAAIAEDAAGPRHGIVFRVVSR